MNTLSETELPQEQLQFEHQFDRPLPDFFACLQAPDPMSNY
jgi:hypothetical protein